MSSINMIAIVMFFSALLAVVSANCVTLINWGPQDREICWFLPAIAPPNDWQPIRTPVITANGGSWTQCNIPGGTGFTIMAIDAGTGQTDCVKPFVKAEITFQGQEGKTFYDISAVDDNYENNGIHKLYPSDYSGPTCMCDVFPCYADCVYLCPGCSGPENTFSTDLTVEMWTS
ncbi:hypothetical protein BDZ45DRAFT_690322 [Acephala macrosclerotiorum]|nr:hypothetical protein BDZ45DRAFT_690322 [Acephala macrosclerotiorum]